MRNIGFRFSQLLLQAGILAAGLTGRRAKTHIKANVPPATFVKPNWTKWEKGMLGLKILRVTTAIAILLLALFPRSSRAQVLYGSIVGTLQDQTGAAVPDAPITVTNKDTGQTRASKSDEQGNFNITNVLPGRYEVKVAATGFRAVTQQNL